MDSVRDFRVLLGDDETVVSVHDQPLPHDDGIDDASIPQDVGFQLVQFFKGQRWNLALKFRVNLKRIQIHHQTVPS